MAKFRLRSDREEATDVWLEIDPDEGEIILWASPPDDPENDFAVLSIKENGSLVRHNGLSKELGFLLTEGGRIKEGK